MSQKHPLQNQTDFDEHYFKRVWIGWKMYFV